jgi:capsular exopolysaccharide synthesis family protein
MSRIHDALKKAELEKTELEKAGGFAAGAATVPLETPEAGAPENGERIQKPLRSLREDPVKAGIMKALEERCRRLVWKPHPGLALFVNGNNHASGTEEFRSLRSRLYLTRGHQPLRKLLITSALPKEGKTFTAVNLSLVLAKQADCRVLLIDADLRLPQLAQQLGAPSAPGLTEYLRGELDEFAIIQRDTAESFYFIPSGSAVTNPSELVGNGRVKILLDHLAPAFDWVILDSPPVIPVSDAKLLAGLCDGTLFVARAGKTPYDLAKKACREFRDKGLLGVVLNQAIINSNYSYYYGRPAGKK